MLWLVIRQYAVVPYEECRFIKSVINSRKFKRTQSAFTLVEVMISTFIFGLVILVALVSVGKGIELVYASRQNTRASQILQSELELLRTLPWDTFKIRRMCNSPLNSGLKWHLNLGVISLTEESKSQKFRQV